MGGERIGYGVGKFCPWMYICVNGAATFARITVFDKIDGVGLLSI